MHELSIALSILDMAAEEAERHGGGRIVAIHMRLGSLAGVVQEALQSAYDMARAESAFPDAVLVIEEVPTVVYCATCAAERTLDSLSAFRCPICRTPTADIVRGRELEIVALEMES